MARTKMCSTAPAMAGVVVQEGPDAFRHREHPSAHGKRRQDVIDKMGGGLDHAAGVTGRTHTAALILHADTVSSRPGGPGRL